MSQVGRRVEAVKGEPAKKSNNCSNWELEFTAMTSMCIGEDDW